MSARRILAGLMGLGLALLLVQNLTAADFARSPYFSECLALNVRGLKDETGQRGPWIEIYNPAAYPVYLAGWSLTDNSNQLTRWRFPNVVLGPEKEMVIHVTGQNRTQDLRHLHTSFRLQKEGGFLALVNRQTNVVSTFSYGPAVADRSEGRVRGEPALTGRFLKPTPGKPNSSSGPGFAPEVIFSSQGGVFREPFPLELRSSSPGATVRFTLDGQLPTTNSPAYVTPLWMTNTAYVRARAYQADRLPGPPASRHFQLLGSNVLTFNSSLPLLIMDSLGRSIPASGQDSFAHLTFFEPSHGRASFTNPPALQTRSGFHIRGSTSSGMPQPGYALKLLDEFNEEVEHEVLGLPAESEWVLYAPNHYDPVLIHNPFIHQLSRDMGRYSSRTRFVEVFMVRGSGPTRTPYYQGLYVLEEKIKIGPHRVAIDHLDSNDLKPPKVTGGYLLKFDRLGPGENGFHNQGDRGMAYVEPKEQNILMPQRRAQRDYIQQYFQEFEEVLHGSDWLSPEKGYRAYLDVPAAIDFHVLEVLSGNVDAIVLSTYLHKPRRGKITFGPHWDFDRALGSTDGRDENPRNWNTGHFFDAHWWPRLFSDVDFWQAWVDRWQELRENHFSQTNLNRLIDQLAGELREAQPRQYRQWDFSPRGGSYQTEIELMKEWLARRTDFIDGQLAAPPLLRGLTNAASGQSTLTVSAGTNSAVFYTLDGTDPRLPQGGVSSAARTYSNAVPLQAGTMVTARAYDPKRQQYGGPNSSTPWSRRVSWPVKQAAD